MQYHKFRHRDINDWTHTQDNLQHTLHIEKGGIG